MQIQKFKNTWNLLILEGQQKYNRGISNEQGSLIIYNEGINALRNDIENSFFYSNFFKLHLKYSSAKLSSYAFNFVCFNKYNHIFDC